MSARPATVTRPDRAPPVTERPLPPQRIPVSTCSALSRPLPPSAFRLPLASVRPRHWGLLQSVDRWRPRLFSRMRLAWPVAAVQLAELLHPARPAASFPPYPKPSYTVR